VRCPDLKELPTPLKGKTGWPWTEESDGLPENMSDGKPWPKISIVTPSYNQGQFIEETIRSVLLQGYPNLEYVIIDGSSTDNSVEIIKEYEPWLTYWVSEPDRGQSHAINKGFERAHGEILSWLNSDDFLLPGALSHVVTAYRENPSAVAWVGGCHRIDPDWRILSTVIPRELDRDNMADWGRQGWFFQPSCFFAVQAWHKVGSLDDNLHFAFDLDLWLKLATVGDFMIIPKIISAATIHSGAKTQVQVTHMHAEIAVIQIRHGYQEIAMRRLVHWFERPSLNDEIRSALKAKVRRLARRFVFWKKRQQNRYLQGLINSEDVKSANHIESSHSSH